MNKIIGDIELLQIIDDIAIELNSKIKKLDSIPTLMCVLDGAFRFYSDLVGCVTEKVLCDFIKVSSYDGKEQGAMKIHKFPKYPIKDRDIIIVDDILDTGNTIKYIIDQLNHYNPKSITVITLLHRKDSPILKGVKHIKGYEIGDEWVAGYGMDDLEGTSRNLNYIYEVEKK